MPIEINVNGETSSVDADPATPLLYVLRNDLSLNGPRFGCGLGQCGACTVLIDGVPTRSCVVPASAAVGSEITTLEGLGTAAEPHPVQAAFIAEQAAQCGYCSNGMILSAAALLERNASPSDAQIREALDTYLCRCGTHTRILRAVKRAAGSET
jgi:nicotinate dehydrogenase subunit A